MASSESRDSIEKWQASASEKQRAALVERRRRAKEFLLAQLEVEYAAQQNPMAIWSAWQLCRGDDDGFFVPLPPWAIRYFDGFAAKLREWSERGTPSDRLAEEVGNALGFRARRRNQNPIADWRSRLQGEAWFVRFEIYVGGGLSPTAAIRRVAEDVNSTAATVRRRLIVFARGFSMTPPELVQTRTRLREADEAALEEFERRSEARYAAILRGEPDPEAEDGPD